MPSIPRRRVLQGGIVGLLVGVPGCASINPFTCPDRKAVVIRTKSAEVTPEDPIQFDALPSPQQSFLRPALEEGEYRECPYSEIENKQAFDDLTGTVGDHAPGGTTYVAYDTSYFALSFRVQDQYYSTF